MSGQLVEQWPITTLGELCEVITKGTTPTSVGFQFEQEGINFVKIESITREGRIIEDKLAKVTQDCHDKLKRSQLKEGDILFSIAGALGRTTLVTKDILPANTNQALAIIRLIKSEDVLPEYILKALSTGYTLSQIEKYRGGSAQQNLSLTQMKGFNIPLPPLEEQQRIVSILDEAFENIQNGTKQAEHKLHNGKEMFQSVVANIFLQKGDGWIEKTLGDVCENLDRKRIPITKNKRESGEIPYYGASGIVDYVKDYIFDENLLLVSEDGANLLARTYPIAFSISGKTWVNNHAHVLRFENMVTQRFMEYYLNSIRLEPYVSGMAQPKLNQKSLNSIPVPEPPLNQQQTIVNKLDSLSQNVALLEENHRSEIESLVELKHSILQEVFNGTL